MRLFFAEKKKQKKTKTRPVTQFNAQELGVKAQNNKIITVNYSGFD